mmetsp:Transcript_19969/g.55500  ORF Transcript_19969/g.55500 Transcript_19969/m.55500 type:complete len:233 (+) Transcript_19969:104-802(+)
MTSSTNKRARRLRLLRSYISMLGGAFRRSCNALARGRVLKAHKRLAQTVSGTVAGHRLSLSDKALQTAQKQQAFARLSCRLKPMRIAPPRDATSSGAERSARARRPFSVTSLPPESLHLSAFTDARSFLAESGDKAFSASAYDDDMAPADDSATAAKKVWCFGCVCVCVCFVCLAEGKGNAGKNGKVCGDRVGGLDLLLQGRKSGGSHGAVPLGCGVVRHLEEPAQERLGIG